MTVREKLQETSFDVLINAAGFTKVDLCETQPERAFLINAEAPRVVAEICDEKNARLIHFSTDYVFDGEKREPYTEEDEANPDQRLRRIEAGWRKKCAERRKIRISWYASPGFLDRIVRVLSTQ